VAGGTVRVELYRPGDTTPHRSVSLQGTS